MSKEFGIDIGGKYSMLALWKRDMLIGNADGAPSRFLTDDKGNLSKTRACFANREVFMNNHALTKYSSAYGSSIGGCFEFYPPQTQEDLSFFNEFSPATVGYGGDITFFNLAAGGQPQQPICIYVPASFYFEYLFYCTLKSNDDLYYSRMKIAAEQKSSGNVYAICYPDYFGKREQQILRNTLRWNNYGNLLLVRNMLPAILHYGYYNGRSGAFQHPTRVVFVDSGFAHTSFAVVTFTASRCELEYLDAVRSVSGRHSLQAMARAAMGDRMEDFKSNRRTYIRGLDTLEKEVVNVNTPHADVVSIDLADILNDDDADMVEVELDQYNACAEGMFAAFRKALARMVAFIKTHASGKVNNVVPIGGNMRVLRLQSILLEAVAPVFDGPARLTQTMNMDECFAVGAALLAHLANTQRLAVQEAAAALFVDDSLASAQLKQRLHSPAAEAYEVALAEYAEVKVPETAEDPRLDASELDVRLAIANIHVEEGRMAALHLQCSEVENLAMECEELKRSSAVCDDAEKVIRDFKEECGKRGVWREARFEGKDTRNGKWWKRTKGAMEEGCNELRTLKAGFDALNEKATKMIRYTNRTKLSFGDMFALDVEMKQWKQRFVAAEKKVKDAFELGLYEIVNRSK